MSIKNQVTAGKGHNMTEKEKKTAKEMYIAIHKFFGKTWTFQDDTADDGDTPLANFADDLFYDFHDYIYTIDDIMKDAGFTEKELESLLDD